MASTALHKIIAVTKGVEAQFHADFTAAHHLLQKADPLSGLSRTYAPINDDPTGAEQLPPESKRLQVRTAEVLGHVERMLTRVLDVTATKAVGNTRAKANLTVDGHVVARDLPAQYLLDLEKRVVNLRTFVAKLPVLDPAEKWQYDEAVDAQATDPTVTVRTRKVPRNHVVAPATDKHPAQVQVYHEDVPVGRWTTIRYSGALPARDVAAMLERLAKLGEAAKVARETANSVAVDDVTPGAAILDYLFRGALAKGALPDTP